MEIVSYRYAIPYLLFFCYLSLLLIWELHCIRHGKRCNAIRQLACLGFLLFLGLRGYIDGDVFMYKEWFDNLPKLFSGGVYQAFKSNPLNFGFSLLMIFTKTIFDHYLFFQFLCSLLHVILLNIVIKEYSRKYYVLSFMLFYVFGGVFLSLNLIRNCISILVFAISLKHIKTFFLKYLLLNLIGSMIHFSSLLFIPLYFILKIKHKQYVFWIFFILGIILYLTKTRYLFAILPSLNFTMAPGVSEKITSYAVVGRLLVPDFSITIGFFERIFSFILIMMFYNSFSQYISSRVFLNIMLFYMCSFFYFGEFADLMGRFMYLFICFYWFLFPVIFGKLRRSNKCIFLMIFVLIGLGKIYSQTHIITEKYDNVLFGIESNETRWQNYRNYIRHFRK
jgi:hypothetical protein